MVKPMYLGIRLVVSGVVIGVIFLTYCLNSLAGNILLASAGSGKGDVTGQEDVLEQQINQESVAVGECRVSTRFPESVLQWCGLITLYADKSGLSPDLIAAVILQESGGKPQAYSHSGAVGLMQVMPRDGLAAKFMCKNGPCFRDRPTIEELRNPEFNIHYGTKLLASW